MARDDGVFWESDVSAAAWLRDAVGPWAHDVGSFVPRGFAAYARVLHPAGGDDYPGGERRRWAELARANGRAAHATMQFHNIVHARGMPSASPHLVPGVGALPVRERTLLIELLAGATATPERCWFCVWEGWGSLDDQGIKARVELPNRQHLLYAGPIAAALAVPPQSPERVAFSSAALGGHSPSPLTREEKVRFLERSWCFGPASWWPDDRAWVVVTEIEFGCTYLGGSVETIERVLAHPELEAWPAQLSDRIHRGGRLTIRALYWRHERGMRLACARNPERSSSDTTSTVVPTACACRCRETTSGMQGCSEIAVDRQVEAVVEED